MAATALAMVLVAIDATSEMRFLEQWPILFSAGAAGARSLLTAVATSMITVADVVFSITIVALSLTSSQYTSRVLRNFMRDQVNQMVLGVFVGIFAYCLIVLRTIRAGDEGAFVPSLAVLGGMILAFLGIAILIYFIHHIAMSIQASTIIAAAAAETIAAIDHLFPAERKDQEDEEADPGAEPRSEQEWTTIPSRKTGYLETLDWNGLRAVVKKRGITVRMDRGLGEFVIEGTPLLAVAGPAEPGLADELRGVYVISRLRTVQQDAGFGIRQIVDIALKALSPGINDTTTAVMCVDYLAAILVRLAPRRIDLPPSRHAEKAQILARSPRFDDFLAEAFNQIRQNASGNVAILARLLQVLETIGRATSQARRRQVLRWHADAIMATAEQSIDMARDGGELQTAMQRLSLLYGDEHGQTTARLRSPKTP